MELFKNTNFDFLGKKWPFIIGSLVLTAAGLISLAVHGGPNYGIDFKGGALIYLRFNQEPPVQKIRSALESKVTGEVSVQQITGQPEVLVGTEIHDEKELNAEYRDFNSLLADSDFVSVHVPLSSGTQGLFDAAKFYRMKPTAFLINTARGSVVDEAALVHALESNKIAGAALDVYENEPFLHSGLKRLNVVLAPHIASASLETRTKMACIAATNVRDFFDGKRPPNILNPEVIQVG